MTEDLADEAVTGDKIEDGAVELSVEQIIGPPTIVELGGSDEATVSCEEGEVVVGDGFQSKNGFQPNVSQFNENLWVVDGQNTGNTEITLITVALCTQIARYSTIIIFLSFFCLSNLAKKLNLGF
jgi:hypothetical protein